MWCGRLVSRGMLLLVVFAAHAQPALAACNDGNHFSSYLEEWLRSNEQVRARVKARFVLAQSPGGGTAPYLDLIVSDYKTYFGQRAVPIAEIGKCSTVGIMSNLNVVLQRIDKAASGQ